MRTRPTKILSALVLTLALCCLPRLEAQAIDSSDILRPLEIGVDVAIIRPLGLASMLVGAVMFVPALMLSAPGLSTTYDEALEIFITIPYESVFEQPLGDF